MSDFARKGLDTGVSAAFHIGLGAKYLSFMYMDLISGLDLGLERKRVNRAILAARSRQQAQPIKLSCSAIKDTTSYIKAYGSHSPQSIKSQSSLICLSSLRNICLCIVQVVGVDAASKISRR
jgi:hypothetical protein